MEFLPWYIIGPVIGVIVLVMLLGLNKMLGISSSLQHFCSMLGCFKTPYFSYDWKQKKWSLYFAFGLIMSGVFAHFFGPEPSIDQINPATLEALEHQGWILQTETGWYPAIFTDFNDLRFLITFGLFGGILVGFGVRYANGCTSGHAIMGLAQLSWSSLLAVAFFFIGGLLATWLIIPILISIL